MGKCLWPCRCKQPLLLNVIYQVAELLCLLSCYCFPCLV
ncbi:hypothetical protein OIU84_028067 [Salix udensis]|uniref:Uncharacterized protein n=1 Tax=Salix udensis TaxID=889485 RepID=A0AAD6P864_9ROSI|nr:hypothetical protein OIU84_028067 [Salix udensis]